MKNIIIITGHNKYASGVYSSLEMVSGNLENIYAVDFLSNDTDASLADKFNEITKNKKDFGILFACDLLGGTPYKEAAKLAFNNKNIRVVTGANMGGIIDSNFKLSMMEIDALAKNLIIASTKNLMILDTTKQKIENDINDGI